MLEALWLVPALPLGGCALLALGGARLGRRATAAVGVGSVGLAALTAALVAGRFLTAPPPGGRFVQPLWRWIGVEGYSAEAALLLDPLALVMTLVVTGVGFVIHLYSAEFMAHETAARAEGGYRRFFAVMNLFVGAMLLLVLASDLLLLYVGWEGVGLASYLLIGFWYHDPENGRAARKAFLVTRIGDTALAIGLLLIATHLGTLEIEAALGRAAESWPTGSPVAVAAAALLLGGAVGKSAQLPLQTWLPDAMAGPTPVSALIHAATMVTAGVYLVARTHVLFVLAPPVMAAVAVIGALTLLLAGLAALAQRDIKRILAYSTMSQIGYMFLGLGVGAFSASIFHLMTHAFFKALLFLGAGALILALDHEHDIFRMGGLRRRMPATFWTFLAGAGALAGVPLVTAGFYSKDLILWQAWSAPRGGAWLWAAGLAGTLLTALYTFRLVFVVFFGRSGPTPSGRPGPAIVVSLLVLAVLSVVGGLVEVPATLGGAPHLSDFLAGTFARSAPAHGAHATEALFQGLAALASLAGLLLAWLWFAPHRRAGRTVPPGVGTELERAALAGFGFDHLYRSLLVAPFVALANALRDEPVDRPFTALAALVRRAHRRLARSQTGALRWYAAGLALGAVLLLALVVLG